MAGILLLVALLIWLAGCQLTGLKNQPATPAGVAGPGPATGCRLVHVLDVGQADSILVQLPDGRNMLIDAGNNEDGPFIVDYLHRSGVQSIDYLIGTHPHEDHIGGLDTVLQKFPVRQVYMPEISYDTKSYHDVLRAVRQRGLKVLSPAAGQVLLKDRVSDQELQVEILWPDPRRVLFFDEVNDHSIIARVSYGKSSFLFTGDAGRQVEEALLSSKARLGADVLKVGHHGSNSSTSNAFLRAVRPQIAVISAGRGNDYGHPHRETLQRLIKNKIRVYRTDQDGTIVFTCDGKTIAVRTAKHN
ncbi:MAG: ComEC/Rec2 family competence protein [Desulfurispora sp.]|uniref:ComEC/Rec2 family competence protein n=1 Tax=Desulfurispora sp. TaxID=3014275 RepID=UPI004048EF35